MASTQSRKVNGRHPPLPRAPLARADFPMAATDGAGAGAESSTLKLSSRAANIDLAKTSKTDAIKLAQELENELNAALIAKDYYQRRAREEHQELDRRNTELASSLNLANIAIDAMAKRIVYHHPRKD